MVSSSNMHLQIPTIMVPPLLTHRRIILSQVVFLNLSIFTRCIYPVKYFFIFLFFIKVSLVLAGLTVEDQKAIFQLFLKPEFLSKVKQCLSNSLCCVRHLLVSQTCYVSALHRERPANLKTLKKQLVFLVYLSWLKMCLSRLHLQL